MVEHGHSQEEGNILHCCYHVDETHSEYCFRGLSLSLEWDGIMTTNIVCHIALPPDCLEIGLFDGVLT